MADIRLLLLLLLAATGARAASAPAPARAPAPYRPVAAPFTHYVAEFFWPATIFPASK